jgi:hypothetical protein
MRALRQLRELHAAYDKHDFVLAGFACWDGATEPIWVCACGEFGYTGYNGEKVLCASDMRGDWVYKAWQSLSNKNKELFGACLRRIGWVPDTKQGAKLIYGDKGAAEWGRCYGSYETKQEAEQAKEAR